MYKAQAAQDYRSLIWTIFVSAQVLAVCAFGLNLTAGEVGAGFDLASKIIQVSPYVALIVMIGRGCEFWLASLRVSPAAGWLKIESVDYLLPTGVFPESLDRPPRASP